MGDHAAFPFIMSYLYYFLDFWGHISLQPKLRTEKYEKTLDKRRYIWYNCNVIIFRGVAQFGRALRSGRRGRKFESCHSDQRNHGTALPSRDFVLSERRVRSSMQGHGRETHTAYKIVLVQLRETQLLQVIESCHSHRVGFAKPF